MKKDRLLLVSLLPLNVQGGGERYVLNIFLSCLKNGVDTEIVFPAQQPETEAFLDTRLMMTVIRMKWKGKCWVSEQTTWKDLLESLWRYEVVHLNQYLSANLTFDVIANTASDQYLLFTSLGHEPCREIFFDFYQQCPRHRFIEISKYAASRTQDYGIKADFLCAGIWLKDLKHPLVHLNKENWAENEPLKLCSIGRVLPHKGIEISIKALGKHDCLHVAGNYFTDSQYVTYLRTITNGRQIKFLGMINDESRNQLIAECDALLASSSHMLYDKTTIDQPELFGLVLIEALAMGILPISSDIPSFREIMEHCGLGAWIYKEGDHTSLRSKLDQLRETAPWERQKLVLAAREGLRNWCLWDDYCQRLQVLIQKEKA